MTLYLIILIDNCFSIYYVFKSMIVRITHKLLQATKNDQVGHIWPMGLEFDTCVLEHLVSLFHPAASNMGEVELKEHEKTVCYR